MYADTDRRGYHQLVDLSPLEYCTIDAALEKYIEHLEALHSLIQGNAYTHEQLEAAKLMRDRISKEIYERDERL